LGDAEHRLLVKIRESSQIDYFDLYDLEKILHDADIYTLRSFFKENGVIVLLSIFERLSPSSDRWNELDVGIMIQTLRCLKAIMGDSTMVGMEGLLAAQSLMTCIIRCLIFDFKPLAMLVHKYL